MSAILTRSVMVAFISCGSSAVNATEYAFAEYGSARLALESAYVVSGNTGSPASVLGIGYKFDKWAVELAFHDMGTYRYVLSKEVQIDGQVSIGRFHFPVRGNFDLPGYAEIRVRGQSIGARRDFGPMFLRGRAVYTTLDGTLHTPVGYQIETVRGWLPQADLGVQLGHFTVTYSVAPYWRGTFVGAQFDF